MHAQSADMDQAAEDGSNGERGSDEQESTVVVDVKKAKVVVPGLPSIPSFFEFDEQGNCRRGCKKS